MPTTTEPLSLEEIQKASLHILEKIADLCDQLHLRYYLIYGTLIGAIRHKGFIPWDDDLDIMMPRPDYEKLITYFIENTDALKPLELFEPRVNPDYPYMIARISDNRYILDVTNEKDYGIGVFIDIYPYDGLGNTPQKALHYGLKGDRLSSLCFQATRQKFAIGTTTSVFRKIIKLPVFWFSKMVGKNYFQRKLAQLANKYDYDSSEYVGCFVWLSGGEKDIFKKEWFDESLSVPFCSGNFFVPKKYDLIQRHAYGDYMQLPPEKERIGHHYYQAYKK